MENLKIVAFLPVMILAVSGCSSSGSNNASSVLSVKTQETEVYYEKYAIGKSEIVSYDRVSKKVRAVFDKMMKKSFKLGEGGLIVNLEVLYSDKGDITASPIGYGRLLLAQDDSAIVVIKAEFRNNEQEILGEIKVEGQHLGGYSISNNLDHAIEKAVEQISIFAMQQYISQKRIDTLRIDCIATGYQNGERYPRDACEKIYPVMKDNEDDS